MTFTDMSDRHQATPASLLLRACALSMTLMTAGMVDAASPLEAGTLDLQMRFLEVDRHEIMDLGIDWNEPANEDGIAFGLSDEQALTGSEIDTLLEILEQEGKVDILAEPNLTSIEGEPASFMIGGEVPVSVPGSGSDAVEYKPFGMSVEFMPTLGADDRIDVRVRPELTAINHGDMASNDIQLSSFTIHGAEATLDLASGQSFAIAGMFDRERSLDFADLSDLPVIGTLINSARFQRKETELIILVTARSADGNG